LAWPLNLFAVVLSYRDNRQQGPCPAVMIAFIQSLCIQLQLNTQHCGSEKKFYW